MSSNLGHSYCLSKFYDLKSQPYWKFPKNSRSECLTAIFHQENYRGYESCRTELQPFDCPDRFVKNTTLLIKHHKKDQNFFSDVNKMYISRKRKENSSQTSGV